MSKKILFILLIGVFALAACQPAATEAPPEPVEPEPEPTEEPMEEPVEEGPVTNLDADPTGQTIVFWHAMSSGANLEGMEAVVAAFNETNEYGITVEQIAQGRQSELETAVNAAIATGELPNMTQGFPNGMVRWYGLDVIAALNEFIDDPFYGLTAEELAAIYAAAYAAGTVPDGSQVGIPMHQSAQVIFYNFTWAQELGFDSPPTTPAEFKEQACAARAANDADENPDNDGTGGLVYFPDASQISPWIWAFGGELVTADSSAYDLNSQATLDAALFLNDLVTSGCTITTPSYPNPEFAGRLTLFAASSTAGVPFQAAAFEEAGNDDVWGPIPWPGVDGSKYVDAFGQLVGIIETNPEQDLASWIFLKYLTSPETQAMWIDYTGYFPSQTTTDVGTRPQDDALWAEGLSLLEFGKAEPNLAAHGAVRGAIRDAFFAVAEATSEDEIITILNDLNAEAAELVAETQ
jgi:multiple sugar transport system substrate-binding protein/sn-glycerol 3-phosphate transport system substrate-binding protein